MTEWFRCLADVPGVGYSGDPRITRSNLPGHDAMPRLLSHTYEGKRHESLMWPTKDGTTSASPASLHANAPSTPLSTDAPRMHLQRLYEVLELPGTTSDYHFAIQRCIEILWKYRRQDPDLLPEVERLCQLDLRLVEARPETITFEQDGEVRFYHVPAFGYLIRLYEREGFLVEALEVTRRGARFDQVPEVERLRERLGQVESEER